MNAQEIKIIRKFCKYENLPFKAVKKEFKKQTAEKQQEHLQHMQTIIKARQANLENVIQNDTV